MLWQMYRMHELSVCQSMLRQVQELAFENHARTITAINLQIGPLSGVEPQLMNQAFPIASRDSIAANATLVIETMPIRVHCDACNTDSDATMNDLSCRACGNTLTQLIGGDEILLTDIELER